LLEKDGPDHAPQQAHEQCPHLCVLIATILRATETNKALIEWEVATRRVAGTRGHGPHHRLWRHHHTRLQDVETLTRGETVPHPEQLEPRTVRDYPAFRWPV